MKTTKQDWKRIKDAIRSKYAWPGGYPLYIVMSDGCPICVDCAKKEFKRLVGAYHNQDNSGWRPILATINYEDENCYCDNCNKQIESAYGGE